jgi:ethanolamine phosphate transferase 2 subunit G
MQFWFLDNLELTIEEISVSSILLQYMSFFAFGGSNAISSVDLSSAYNGVNSFNVVAVGALTFISNWAGPIYWTFASCRLLGRKRDKGQGISYLEYVYIPTIFTAGAVISVMMACTLLRTHLFIWTVFSPKYLYCMAWCLGQHLIINVCIGGLLYLVGG